MVYHCVVWQKTPADTVESPVMCWGALHKEQLSQGRAIDGQCAEVELFQKWQGSPEPNLERTEEDRFLPDLLTVNSVGDAQQTTSQNDMSQLANRPGSVGLKLRGREQVEA